MSPVVDTYFFMADTHAKQSGKRKRVSPPAIKTLDELIDFTMSYEAHIDYGFNANALDGIVFPLLRLRDMHGMDTVKTTLVRQILYLVQGYNTREDFLHTVITGKPGTGKTELAGIIAEVYAGLGFLQKGHVHAVKRPDLIGKFIGHTAVQTRQHIEEAFGGVLLIDEAYTIGRAQDDKDGFSKECVDEINRALTEHRDKFVCIIAGYDDALRNYFFSVNEGLESRFHWWYHIDDYSEAAVTAIFAGQVRDAGWEMTDDATEHLTHLIKKGDLTFDSFGRDTSVLFMKCRVAYSTRMFGKDRDFTITLDDLKEAHAMYTKNRRTKRQKSEPAYPHMYL